MLQFIYIFGDVFLLILKQYMTVLMVRNAKQRLFHQQTLGISSLNLFMCIWFCHSGFYKLKGAEMSIIAGYLSKKKNQMKDQGQGPFCEETTSSGHSRNPISSALPLVMLMQNQHRCLLVSECFSCVWWSGSLQADLHSCSRACLSTAVVLNVCPVPLGRPLWFSVVLADVYVCVLACQASKLLPTQTTTTHMAQSVLAPAYF